MKSSQNALNPARLTTSLSCAGPRDLLSCSHAKPGKDQFLFMDDAPMRSSHDDEAGQSGERSAADSRHWYESAAGQARLAQATEHFRLGHVATANDNGATDRVDGAESRTDD